MFVRSGAMGWACGEARIIMRRLSQDDLLPATFEAGCITFVVSYVWFFFFWLAFPPPLNKIAVAGPLLLLGFHLLFVFTDLEDRTERWRRLLIRMAFTALLYAPLVVTYSTTR